MAKFKEYGYDIQNGKAIIPEWVEEIGECAFFVCKNLKSITLPRWVKKIGFGGFWGCSSLTSITIPPSATTI